MPFNRHGQPSRLEHEADIQRTFMQQCLRIRASAQCSVARRLPHIARGTRQERRSATRGSTAQANALGCRHTERMWHGRRMVATPTWLAGCALLPAPLPRPFHTAHIAAAEIMSSPRRRRSNGKEHSTQYSIHLTFLRADRAAAASHESLNVGNDALRRRHDARLLEDVRPQMPDLPATRWFVGNSRIGPSGTVAPASRLDWATMAPLRG